MDWEEYFSHYLRDLLGLDEDTIKQIEKKPERISRDIKAIRASVIDYNKRCSGVIGPS